MGSISDNNNYNMKQHLSPTVRIRIEFLRYLQSQYDELEADYLEQRKALEAKYQKLYEPLHKKRYEIVNGIQEVEGVTNEVIIEEDNATEEKGVPDFWLTAMKAHNDLAEEIKGRDEGALKFLKDIKWSRLHDPQGFKLEFYFNPNPYFKNSVLTKTYRLTDETDPVLERAFGTDIVWYPGKCLTKKVVKKKKPRVGSKNTKPITRIENCESFFTFFNPPEFPKDEDDLDDDAYEELLDRMEQDYNMGAIIRDKIIPHAVSWFTGEAIEEGDDGFDADNNSDDDEDDETEDDGDEDEDKIEGSNKDKDSEEDEEEERGKINWKKDVDGDDNWDKEQEEENWVLKKDMDEADKDTDDDKEEEGKRTSKRDMVDDEDINDDDEEEEEEKGNQGWKKISDGSPKKNGEAQMERSELHPECKQD